MKTKITIAGIGGVGGYFGGLMARNFEDSLEVEIHFLARGNHLKAIQDQGLQVIHGVKSFTTRPAVATDDATAIGPSDFVFIATKSFDLDGLLEQLKSCLHPNTVLIPLLNGVNHREQIQAKLPGHTVVDACVYLVSRLKKDGVIENSGNIQQLYFGSPQSEDTRLRHLEKLLVQAGIEAYLSNDIERVIWEKFIFLSPIATATSYFDTSIGHLLSDPEKSSYLMALVEEVLQVARCLHVPVAADIMEKTLRKYQALPFETTSSMHADFQKGRPMTELESLTGYVIREGAKQLLPAVKYKECYAALRLK